MEKTYIVNGIEYAVTEIETGNFTVRCIIGGVECTYEYKNGRPYHFYNSMGDHEWFDESGKSISIA